MTDLQKSHVKYLRNVLAQNRDKRARMVTADHWRSVEEQAGAIREADATIEAIVNEIASIEGAEVAPNAG